MPITALSISGYRSIRDLRGPIRRLEVIVGPNGCGKTNLYRAVQLLAHAADGTLARALLDEGGMPSVLWAGGRKVGPVRLVVGADLGDLASEIELGLPPRAPDDPTLFYRDPVVKEERIWIREGRRRHLLLERKNATVWARDVDGARVTFPFALWESESVLSQLAEPHRFPVLSTLRQHFLTWRFYHAFRTDVAAPARHPQPGCRTPALAHDGSDLAAALQTIREIGDHPALDEAIGQAFPGSKLSVEEIDGRFSVLLTMAGLQRPLRAAELSDGTLRYLSLLAALLSPRPAPFLAFNEPETSLHPDLLEPLATMFTYASKHSQLLITTHSEALARSLGALSGVTPRRLVKINGETKVAEEDANEEDAGDG